MSDDDSLVQAVEWSLDQGYLFFELSSEQQKSILRYLAAKGKKQQPPAAEPAPAPAPAPAATEPEPEPEPGQEPREAETQTLAQRGERSRTALHVPEPSPLARALDDSITEVEAWLASLGLAQYAQAAAESAEFCDIEDYENLLEDEERWGECLAELGMTDVGDDAHRRLREGIAALNNTRLG